MQINTLKSDSWILKIKIVDKLCPKMFGSEAQLFGGMLWIVIQQVHSVCLPHTVCYVLWSAAEVNLTKSLPVTLCDQQACEEELMVKVLNLAWAGG